MRWFRSRVRSGASLALVALAIQFVVSFAHVHIPGAGTGPVTGSAGWALGAPLAGRSTTDTGGAPPAPSKPHLKGLAGDPCAICTLIQMSGATPPVVCAQVP